MDGTGTLCLLSGASSPEASGWIMFVHRPLANLVRVYRIGQAAMAVLAHLLTGFDIHEMWSVKHRTTLAKD